MSELQQSAELRQHLERLIAETIKKETRECFRVYKGTVVDPPNGETCSVHLAGDSTVLSLPYSTAISDCEAGDAVLVGVIYNSLSNAVVWQKVTFQWKGGGSGLPAAEGVYF